MNSFNSSRSHSGCGRKGGVNFLHSKGDSTRWPWRSLLTLWYYDKVQSWSIHFQLRTALLVSARPLDPTCHSSLATRWLSRCWSLMLKLQWVGQLLAVSSYLDRLLLWSADSVQPSSLCSMATLHLLYSISHGGKLLPPDLTEQSNIPPSPTPEVPLKKVLFNL